MSPCIGNLVLTSCYNKVALAGSFFANGPLTIYELITVGGAAVCLCSVLWFVHMESC